MEQEYYRFRNIEKLIGKDFAELKTQTIFFADPEMQNDPMEGVKDVYWLGDEIVWRNLFKNYIHCYLNSYHSWMANGEQIPIGKESIHPFYSISNYPTQEFKDLALTVTKKLFSYEDVNLLIKKLSLRKTKIRQNELTNYFDLIHILLTDCILKSYKEIGIQTGAPLDIEQVKLNLRDVVKESYLDEVSGQKEPARNALFFVLANRRNEYHLVRLLNGEQSLDEPNKRLVLIDFPAVYVERLSDITYPTWSAACFMSKCSNSSVWGHYGDSHKGVCLVYSSDEQNGLNLTTLNGAERTNRKLVFNKVNYVEGIREMDFFHSIGNLSQVQLEQDWYSDQQGNVSESYKQVFENPQLWAENYWSKFTSYVTTKSKDWKYENEFRLVLNSESQALKYEFDSLKGIIFGINTPVESKIEIINIIRDEVKSQGRTRDFNFYQAYYCKVNNDIQKRELVNLRISVEDKIEEKQVTLK